jgi:hypothetical protein
MAIKRQGSRPSAVDPSPPPSREPEPKSVYLFRVDNYGEMRWLLNDQEWQMKSEPGESLAALLQRWDTTYYPIKRLTRFAGVARISEAIASMTSIRMRANPAYGAPCIRRVAGDGQGKEVPNG